MRTQKIGDMVGIAFLYQDRLKTAQDVWSAEEKLAEYLEVVEKNLEDEEWFYFDEIYVTLTKLRDGVSMFINEAWECIMYENLKGKLCLFENGTVGGERDVYAHGTQSIYSITLDWVEWKDSALANEDGSKNYDIENDFKGELLEHLHNVVLHDYLAMWLKHIDDMYTRP